MKKYQLHNISRKALYIFVVFMLAFMFISVFVYLYISDYSKDYLYSNIKNIPVNRAGLLLGTSPAAKSGGTNIFFVSRMKAAKQLIDNKKIDYIIASGDNRTVAYNEPKYMKSYLLKIGVSEDAIVSDYGGRRTLDSVLRSSEIFDQNKITIISQKFHNERAIFIARKSGIDAIAYNAKYPFQKYTDNIWVNTKLFLRELFARDMAVLDILFDRQPAILGNSIDIQNENIDGIKRLILE